MNGNMNAREINVDDIQSLMDRHEYSLIYMMSGLEFGKTADIQDIDWNECLEARFFDRHGEDHVYSDSGRLMVMSIDDDQIKDTDSGILEYCLDSSLGKRLIVKEYYDYDDDGQLTVRSTRLAGVE